MRRLKKLDDAVLNEPIVRESDTDAEAGRINSYQLNKLELLFDYFGISAAGADRWRQLCLRLAQETLLGWQVRDRAPRKRGPVAKWNLNERVAKIILRVDEIRGPRGRRGRRQLPMKSVAPQLVELFRDVSIDLDKPSAVVRYYKIKKDFALQLPRFWEFIRYGVKFRAKAIIEPADLNSSEFE